MVHIIWLIIYRLHAITTNNFFKILEGFHYDEVSLSRCWSNDAGTDISNTHGIPSSSNDQQQMNNPRPKKPIHFVQSEQH